MKVYEIQNKFGLENLKLTERPEPRAGARQVVVKVNAVSLNFRDLLVTTGLYNPRMPLPRVPASDGAGEVIAVGEGVTRVKVGDRVTGTFFQRWIDGEVTELKARSTLGGDLDGMLAEQVVLEEDGVIATPAHLSDEEASTLPCAALTAWNALFEYGRLKPGESVLVQGTGGVSIFALQFARAAGARVIATSSSDEKLARVREMGASDLINYKTTPKWDERVREVTNKAGVDHIIEVGGGGTLPQSLKAVRVGGQISLIGVLAGGGEVNPMPILMKSVRVQGIFVGSHAMFAAMNRALAVNQIKPVVDRVFDFKDAGEALSYMQSGAHFGKIVIRVQ
jgi:NADPH:quinone reductase-like Zn-dependent oxidoreductase